MRPKCFSSLATFCRTRCSTASLFSMPWKRTSTGSIMSTALSAVNGGPPCRTRGVPRREHQGTSSRLWLGMQVRTGGMGRQATKAELEMEMRTFPPTGDGVRRAGIAITFDVGGVMSLRSLLCRLLIFGLASGVVAPAAAQSLPPQEPILRIDPGMHTALIQRVGADARCSLLATASYDKTVRLWQLPEGKLLRVLRPPIGHGPRRPAYMPLRSRPTARG